MMDEWTTEVSGAGQQLAFRGYHGKYLVRVQLPDGTFHEQVVTLDSGATQTLDATINTNWVDTRSLVTNTNNDGPGSLRAAITFANSTPGRQTITFDIPAQTAPLIIGLRSALPTITDSIVIDGRTQPGYSGTPAVVIDGNLISAAVDGLKIQANDSIIAGLSVTCFKGDGIEISGSRNQLLGNFIGIRPNGTAGANRLFGIHLLSGTDNQIGARDAGNVVAYNKKDGIYLARLATGNRVQANRVGLGLSGTTAAGNGTYGVSVIGPNNLIGGSSADLGNIISGNIGSGMVVWGNDAKGNIVQFNQIGTNLAGNAAVPNGYYGLELQRGAKDNRILDNTISGNRDGGILIQTATTTGNLMERNRLGIDVTGQLPLQNRTYGISVQAPSNTIRNNVIGKGQQGIRLGTGANNTLVSGNFIGTDVTGTINLGSQFGIYFAGTPSGNQILDNTVMFNRVGVQMESRAIENRISRNRFANNTGLAIDLNGNGVTANDTTDRDNGANRLQNFPAIASAALTDTTALQIAYRISTQVTSLVYPLTVEFYLDDGQGEGRIYLGADQYTTATGSNGLKTATVNVSSVAWPVGARLVATATDLKGNTSEFSPAIVVQVPVVAALSFEVAAPSTATSPAFNDLPMDLSGDARVTALDALIVINALNRTQNTESSIIAYDINGDGRLTPADALAIINQLNRAAAAESSLEANEEVTDQALLMLDEDDTTTPWDDIFGA